MNRSNIELIREHYAEEIGWISQINHTGILKAFAKVLREAFLPAGPWLVYHPSVGYIPTLDADPRRVYHNIRIAIDPERCLNNGEPGLTSSIMQLAAPKTGDRVLHIGCGTGYYTAVWAEIVGESGKVCGIEIDSLLAMRAKQNLAQYKNVQVLHGNGTELPNESFDILVFSAGANSVRSRWLEALNPGGRMIIPFTTSDRNGRLLKVEKQAHEIRASFPNPTPVTYYELIGSREEARDRDLRESIAQHGWFQNGSIHRGCKTPCASCWLFLGEENLCISREPLP